MPVLANAGENNAITAHADALQVMEFSTGYNVETAALLGKMIQNGKVSVGLYGKTQGVGQLAKPSVKFLIGIIDCGAAVYVSWSAKLLRNRPQRHSFANHLLAGRTPRAALFPRKMRRESGGVHVFELARRSTNTSRSSDFCHHQSSIIRKRSALREPIHFP